MWIILFANVFFFFSFVAHQNKIKMKKFVTLLVATVLSVSLYATDCKNEPTNNCKLETEILEGYFCGTGTSTISGACWSATCTVTACGDFEDQTTANLFAGLVAKRKIKEMATVLTYLEENYPCEG